MRSTPLSRAWANDPSASRSTIGTTSARTNFFWMSPWMRPAACQAVQPRGSCQARLSLDLKSPVKKVM